jgi:hypothetical protein
VKRTAMDFSVIHSPGNPDNRSCERLIARLPVPKYPYIQVVDHDEHIAMGVDVGETSPAFGHSVAHDFHFFPRDPIGIVGPNRLGLEIDKQSHAAARIIVEDIMTVIPLRDVLRPWFCLLDL